jgi:alpha-L-fucosidase
MAWEDYLGFLHGQVRELCTQFGEIACIWFDGDWPRHVLDESNAHFAAGGSFEYERLYHLIHTLQPQAVVMNNRHAEPLPGEDVQGFEQDLPGENSAGFNTSSVYGLPLEVCLTINDNWGYHATDANHKSTRRLIHLLARSASSGANLLLNVGPTPLGEIHPAHIQRLKEMGAWLKRHGNGIYGTRAGQIPPTAECVSTRRGNSHYLHVLDYVSDCVRLEGLAQNFSQARLVYDGSPVKMEQRDEGMILTIPPEQRDIYDTVVELE